MSIVRHLARLVRSLDYRLIGLCWVCVVYIKGGAGDADRGMGDRLGTLQKILIVPCYTVFTLHPLYISAPLLNTCLNMHDFCFRGLIFLMCGYP